MRWTAEALLTISVEFVDYRSSFIARIAAHNATARSTYRGGKVHFQVKRLVSMPVSESP